jgi:D-alanyl-D-alanine dipeptidase
MKKILTLMTALFLLPVYPAYSASKITLIADPKVLATPIHENDEPFVDLTEQELIAFGPSPEVPNNTDYTKMRKSVYDKLVKAQEMLPKGYYLSLYEGYRSLELQEKLFDDRYNQIKKEHPDWSHEKVFKETTKMVSPVVNLDGSQNIPPHSTGAAVDVYLINEDKDMIDMGIAPGDWMQDLDGSLAKTDSKKISREAQKNRAIMSNVLTKVGLVNYPTEYWHWSHGDRYWAYNKKKPYAIYGSVKE